MNDCKEKNPIFFWEKAVRRGENETNFSEVNEKITNINATWRPELCMIARNENQKLKNEY